jgi:hypothetical protein
MLILESFCRKEGRETITARFGGDMPGHRLHSKSVKNTKKQWNSAALPWGQRLKNTKTRSKLHR